MCEENTALLEPVPSNMLLSMIPPAAPHLLTQPEHVDSAPIYKHSDIPNPMSMPPSKRPKLSLQTSALPISYGTSSSAITHRLDTTTMTTPTTLNTFTNTFELAVRPSPSSSTVSPAAFLPRAKAHSLSPFCKDRPYDLNLPFGLKPILKNSSISYGYLHSSKPSTASPRVGRRVFFPIPKKVSFRPILEDEIVTYTYTARHVDLSTSEDESFGSDTTGFRGESEIESCPDETSTQRRDVDCFLDLDTQTPLSARIRKNWAEKGCDFDRGRSRQKRSSSAQRWVRKKRRWEWTLEEPGNEALSQCEAEAHDLVRTPLPQRTEIEAEFSITQKRTNAETSTPCIAHCTDATFVGVASQERTDIPTAAACKKVGEGLSPGAPISVTVDKAPSAKVDAGDVQQEIVRPESR